MQRAGHHVVRGAVVTALSALLLVLGGPFAGAQAHVPARTAGPGVHRTTGVDPARRPSPRRPTGPATCSAPTARPRPWSPTGSGAPRPTYATRAAAPHAPSPSGPPPVPRCTDARLPPDGTSPVRPAPVAPLSETRARGHSSRGARMPVLTVPCPPRSRAPLWRAVASFVVIGLALLAALSLSPRLGLDLEGGTQIVLETQDSARVEADRESTDRALEVLRGRVDALGVAEPTLARAGERRIIVELPGVQDPREAARVIGRTAQLGFHVVRGPAAAGHRRRPPAPRAVPRRGRPADPGRARWSSTATASKDAERRAAPGRRRHVGGLGRPSTGRAARSGATLVDRACRTPDGDQRIAIVLDDEVISSPAVQPELCSRRRRLPPRSPASSPSERRGPGGPDQGRRAAGAGRGDRAAHRRRRRSGDAAIDASVEAGDHRHRADRAVHRRGLPADGAAGDDRAGGVRPALLRRCWSGWARR